MNYNDLCEKIDSPTLQRDLEYMRDTGENPAGYSPEELKLMVDYIGQPDVLGHKNSAGGYCCPHYGNTCGNHHWWEDEEVRFGKDGIARFPETGQRFICICSL